MDKENQKKIQINKDRNNLVIQSNKLIRDVRTLRYGLSNQEQRIVVYIISKLCVDDKDELKKVKFNISHYLDVCGIQKSGREYERVKQSIKSLRDKSYWIKDDNGDELLFAWIDTAKINKNKTVELVISEALRPYLKNLSKSFTAYQLINALCLRQKYSLRLYELCKSYLWLGKWETSVDNFREIMLIGNKYELFKEMKRNVIDNSIAEINKYTDINIKYETIRKGRYIDSIIFYISEKKGVQMVMDLVFEQENRLNG